MVGTVLTARALLKLVPIFFSNASQAASSNRPIRSSGGFTFASQRSDRHDALARATEADGGMSAIATLAAIIDQLVDSEPRQGRWNTLAPAA